MNFTRRAARGGADLPTAAVSALNGGNKIEAIKIVRRERGLGLKEAKDEVDAYVRAHPALQASFAAAQGEAKRNALLSVALLFAAGLLLYYFVGKA